MIPNNVPMFNKATSNALPIDQIYLKKTNGGNQLQSLEFTPFPHIIHRANIMHVVIVIKGRQGISNNSFIRTLVSSGQNQEIIIQNPINN
jgi:hypothetical protein